MSEHDNPYDDTTFDGTAYGVPTYGEPMIGPLDAPERDSGWHPVNITQLVMGVAFAGMLLVWALFVADVVSEEDYRWLLPVPWIAAGAAGLVASVWPSRK